MATDGARRKPISVAAVLDRSGSMAGSKLMLLKDTMRFVVSEMGPEDQLALICYDDKVTETLPLMSMDAEGKRAALAAIESVVHGGMTNISGGIQAGIDALRGVFAAGEYNFVEGPPLSNSMQRRSLGPASNSPPPPPPAVVLPDIYKIEISNDYSPMKRDGVMMHRYGITVKSLGAPQGIAKAVVLGAWLGGKDDVMESKQNDGVHFVSIVSSTTLPCVTIRVCFAAGTGIPQSEYIQPLAEIRKDSVQVIDVAVPRRSTPPPPTPLARSDSFVRTKSVNAITSVWLFTDGQANVGIKDPEALSLAARKRMESYKLDASVFTFGFGSDHNRDLLNVLASSTQGMYYFIEGEDTMKSCFADCLGGLVSVVCQQIKLTMQLSEGVNLKRVVTKYKYEIVGRQVSIAMKDLYAEETRDIIFEVDIPACAESVDAGGYSIGTCRLECLNLLAGCLPETVNAPMKVLRPAMVSFESPVNTLVDEQRNRLRVAEALESADRAAKTGDYRQAKTHLTACKEVVEKSKSHTTSYCVGLAQQLQQTEDLVGSESVYKRAGQYALTNMHEEHRAQRCAKATSAPLESPAMYSNASKEVYRTKATKK
jgi:Mg-chelatase subunit ChlD